MFKRKPNSGLSRQDVGSLSAADHRAKTIGCPLNTLVTVRPLDERNMTMSEIGKDFLRIRNNYDGFARRNEFVPAFIWTREIYPDCTGEHMHLKCHVPKKYFENFRTRAIAWMPNVTELDVRKAGLSEYFAHDGKRHSSLLYIAKQMTPQAAFGSNLRRQKGGIILGQRWNASKNLLPYNAPRPDKRRGSNVESDY